MLETENVAVIIPVKNCECYITQSINSMLDQTYRKFKLFIFDNGSTDKTIEIIEDFARFDNRIILIKCDDFGLTKTLNFAITHVSTLGFKYIFRMDADDVSLPKRIETQITEHKKNKCDIVFTRARYIHNNKKIYSVPSFLLNEYLLLRNNLIHPSAMMYIQSTNQLHHFLYDTNFSSAQDYELWTRGNLKIVRITDVLLLYRVHANQISTERKVEQFKNHYDICTRNLKNTFENIHEVQIALLLNFSIKNFSILNYLKIIRIILSLKSNSFSIKRRLKFIITVLIP